MSRPAIFNWIAADAAAISALQTTPGAGSLLLNGTLKGFMSSLTSFTAPIVLVGIQRVVSLTSAGDISGVNFTITGTLMGAVVSEAIAGPHGNTVVTTQLFDSITSVTVDGAVGTNTSIGTGQTGFTDWFSHDYHASNANVGVQITVTGVINYDYQVTCNDVMDSAVTVVTFTPIVAMTGATTNQLAALIIPVRFSRIKINSSTTNATLKEVIIQQGLVY